MSKKSNILIAIVIVLLLAVGFAYWYLFFYGPGNQVTPVVTSGRPSTGFTPFSSSPVQTPDNNGNTNNSNTTQASPAPDSGSALPSLRLLSNTPVGGYSASTTANTKLASSTTFIRWIDRGRGNVYEARKDSLDITTLSNTLLPKVYESVWNKNINAFIGTILGDNDTPTVLYSQIIAQTAPAIVKPITASSTDVSTANTQTLTPFQLKGKNLPKNMIAYAASPDGSKIFMLTNENNAGVGYIGNFDGTTVKKIFDTPLTQLNVEWPEANTIAITTKGSASQPGFLYFINPKTGLWKKILGPTFGLSAKVSHDAKYVIASAAGSNQSIFTSIYTVSTLKSSDPIIRTLADKCAWGNFNKNMVYCAVPTQIDQATYPDDWYRGSVSFIDKIWQVDAITGEVHLVTSIVDQSDRIIDAYNLGLDAKDDWLFFMNKNDLSLWAFDLFAKQ